MGYAATTFAYNSKEECLELLKSRIIDVFGWKLIDYDQNNWFVVLTKGENDKEAFLCKVELKASDNEIVVLGYQFYDSADKKPYSYGYADRYWAIGRWSLRGEKGVCWLYGNKDALMIVNKNFIEGNQGEMETQVTAVYFGRFVPAYDDYYSIVDLGDSGETGSGTNMVLKVEDASKFELNRAYVIADAEHAEKVIVVNRDTNTNTITVDKLNYSYKPKDVATAETVGTGETYRLPVVIGEMPRPYIILDWWKSTPQTLFSNVGEPSFVSMSDTRGVGQVVSFYEPQTLVDAATFDQLNQDRYLFETYIYSDNPSGFYGKFDMFYVLGTTGIQPEITVLNDATWIYRAFQVMGLGDLVAIRESRVS
jgi:hypothetical protein